MAFTKKNIVNVGVAITIDSRLEAVIIDKQARQILDYKKVSLEYNFQTKEISDYTTFASMLKTMLFDEMGYSPKNIEVSLTIPNIHFAVTQLNANTDGSGAISMALSTMAQDSYLFKRHEPAIAYQQYPGTSKDSISVVYAAVQEDAIAQIKDSLDSIGIENYTINNPYASIINALNYIGTIQPQVNSGEVWNFVQITNNGFTLFSMLGTKILEINDMPIPLKTFAPEEIYESMALSLQNNLSIYPASSLFVLSRTDLLSAQTLLQNMDLRGDVAFLENNKFLQSPLLEMADAVDNDLAKIISVEVIGSAIADKTSPLKLCYSANKDDEDDKVYGFVNFMGREIPISETTITYLLCGVIAFIIAVSGLLYGIFYAINKSNDKTIANLESKKAEIQKQINEVNGKAEGNVENIIADITKKNDAAYTYFSTLSAEIPTSIWLNYFYADADGGLAIQGDTSDVNSLYGFFKNIRMSVKDSDISLTKLEYNDIDALLADNSSLNSTIAFEISNAKYSNSISMEASKNIKPGEKQNGQQNNNANPSEKQPNNVPNNNTPTKPTPTNPADEELEELVPPSFEPEK